jgi:hypothetical protein
MPFAVWIGMRPEGSTARSFARCLGSKLSEVASTSAKGWMKRAE